VTDDGEARVREALDALYAERIRFPDTLAPRILAAIRAAIEFTDWKDCHYEGWEAEVLGAALRALTSEEGR